MVSSFNMQSSLVQEDGISCDGVWYYHPAMLIHLGEECQIRKIENGRKAIIYNMDGSTWQGLAQAMETSNKVNKRS